MTRVLCVLYPDPQTGYPPRYVRDAIPEISVYANGQKAPHPTGAPGFKPGELVGCVSGELGLRPWLEHHGHELIVTSDKEGPHSAFEHYLPEAEVVISQPFWPAYLGAERIARAKKLKLALTAGVGYDHVDLKAAAQAGNAARRLFGAGRDDLIIGIAFPRYVDDTIKLARRAAHLGVRVLALTDSSASPLARFADLTLLVRAERRLAANSEAAVLAVIEALCDAVALRAKHSVEAAATITESVLPWLTPESAMSAAASIPPAAASNPASRESSRYRSKS